MAIEALSDIARAGGSAFTPGGGAVSFTNVTVNIPSAAYNEVTVSVLDASATTSKYVLAFLVPNQDWDADDLRDLTVGAAVLTDGSVTFFINRAGPIVGDLSLAYLLG